MIVVAELFSKSRTYDMSYRMHEIEYAFVVFYVVEVLLRICVNKCRFFLGDGWAFNLADLVITSVGIFEVMVQLLHMESSRKFNNFTILRFVRILRIFKLFRVFTELRLMTLCVLNSALALCWAVLFMLVVIALFSLLLFMSKTNFMVDHPDGADKYPGLHQYFDTFGGTMLTLLQSSTGGIDWGDVFAAVQLCGALPSFLFLMYFVFFYFSFLNVVTSMFVDKAMKVAKPNVRDLAKERAQQEEFLSQQLGQLFQHLDRDRSGAISLEQLRRAAKNENVSQRLELLGIPLRHGRDAETFYSTMWAMVEGSGRAELDEVTFVEACLKMKGQASSLDVQFLIVHLQELQVALTPGRAAVTVDPR